MDKINKKDKQVIHKRSFSTVLIAIFFIIILFIIGAVYALDNYYFKDKDIEFTEADYKANVMKKKSKNLKQPDLSIFKSERFKELQEGYWHEFDETQLDLGNEMPFELKKEEEGEDQN